MAGTYREPSVCDVAQVLTSWALVERLVDWLIRHVCNAVGGRASEVSCMMATTKNSRLNDKTAHVRMKLAQAEPSKGLGAILLFECSQSLIGFSEPDSCTPGSVDVCVRTFGQRSLRLWRARSLHEAPTVGTSSSQRPVDLYQKLPYMDLLNSGSCYDPVLEDTTQQAYMQYQATSRQNRQD